MAHHERLSLQMSATGLAICAILMAGILTLVLSVAFLPSLILAFVGLSLTFWGTLLLYVRPSQYVRSELLVSILPSLKNINNIVKTEGLEGKAVYLPPKYLRNPESSLIFIPSRKDAQLLKPEKIEEERFHSENPEGLFLTPPGLVLSQQFEKAMKTTSLKTDMTTLTENLPRILIEELEIAKGVSIQSENDVITVEMNRSAFAEVCIETTSLERIYESIGCPLCSAIACALTKATAKPICILKEDQSENGKTIKIQYRIIQEEES